MSTKSNPFTFGDGLDQVGEDLTPASLLVDRSFGEDYSEKHPLLVGAVLIAAGLIEVAAAIRSSRTQADG